MADYKLCPKCNNPMDLNETYCPYCWDSAWVVFWGNQIRRENVLQIKKVSRLIRFIILLFVLPIISLVITFIMWLISEIFGL